MSKFTPGPWEVVFDKVNVWPVAICSNHESVDAVKCVIVRWRGADHNELAHTFIVDGVDCPQLVVNKEAKANARLIAAAPDLYEAVMAFLTCLPADMSQWRSLGMDTTALTMARIKGCAAMAKAGWPDDEPPVEDPDEAYCDRCNAYLGTGSNPGELCANCTAYDDELSRGEA